MMDRLQQVPLWHFVLAAVLLGALIYATGVDGFIAVVAVVGVVLTALATIASAVFQVWNPFEPKPKPHLKLWPVDGEETTSHVLGAEWHAVDVDAVVENARETAMAATPQSGMLLMGKYVEPTEADHEKYKADVEAYADDVRAWAQEAQEWLHERALVLKAEVIQHNPTSVDADDAEVFVTFPSGTEEFGDDDDPPEAPEHPKFPLRPTLTGQVLRGHPMLRASALAMRGGAFPMGNEDVLERLTELQDEVSWGYPRLTKERDGTLKLSYRSQTIRHRQAVPSGDPFRVRLPAGEHEVHWEVCARNLSDSAKGVWKLSCAAEPTREPINNVYDLEAALRGEPIRDFDWKELFANQADEA